MFSFFFFFAFLFLNRGQHCIHALIIHRNPVTEYKNQYHRLPANIKNSAFRCYENENSHIDFVWLKTYLIILSPMKNLDGCTLMDTCIRARTWQAYIIFLPNILPVSSYFELFSGPLEVCIFVKSLNPSANYSSKWPMKAHKILAPKKVL